MERQINKRAIFLQKIISNLKKIDILERGRARSLARTLAFPFKCDSPIYLATFEVEDELDIRRIFVAKCVLHEQDNLTVDAPHLDDVDTENASDE